MTVFILAAGMGSRYGGLKQIDPFTEHGEFILPDFSVYDAIQGRLRPVLSSLSRKKTTKRSRKPIGHSASPK